VKLAADDADTVPVRAVIIGMMFGTNGFVFSLVLRHNNFARLAGADKGQQVLGGYSRRHPSNVHETVTVVTRMVVYTACRGVSSGQTTDFVRTN
jgi:hypothetical protein